jgi:hypothetical protein
MVAPDDDEVLARAIDLIALLERFGYAVRVHSTGPWFEALIDRDHECPPPRDTPTAPARGEPHRDGLDHQLEQAGPAGALVLSNGKLVLLEPRAVPCRPSAARPAPAARGAR